ncbi:protein-export chaperone SecB [Aliamphritea hakodatensis]|uniref:protein-export chaperone SecB n=1 Tax=Aliamphritea hakodatensis TaxID=2895352 RepID=UPI0022FDA040|nr:protein-export chaperone SecB [Aliamphritea hakodatensis]
MSAIQQPKVGFEFESGFVKDLSFENPFGPLPDKQQYKAITSNITPKIDIQRLSTDRYGVQLTVTLEGFLQDKCIFITEVSYHSDVRVINIPEPVRPQILNVDVPQAMLQKVNEVVAGTAHCGGLPQMQITEIDFRQHYNNK